MPVHVVSCLAWFGGLYWAISQGLDVSWLLDWLPFVSDSVLDRLRNNPQIGSVALAYTAYKVISPLRYLMTVGLCGALVRVLGRRGLLPTSTQLRKQTKDKMRDWRKDD